MGGWGSGRWYRYGTRPLAEHCLQLDINRLTREDLLRPGLSYSVRWDSGSNIGIETFPEAIELSYTINPGKEDEEHIRYHVPYTRTPCNFGGYRYWFICPSRRCGRRVAKLYSLRRYFLCRHCHNLAYASQNEDKVARLNRKMRKLRSKVGGSSDDLISPFPEKPKGMHWETFLRLEQKDFEANREKMRIISEQISRLETEVHLLRRTGEEEDYAL
jgi:hypothetical protein